MKLKIIIICLIIALVVIVIVYKYFKPLSTILPTSILTPTSTPFSVTTTSTPDSPLTPPLIEQSSFTEEFETTYTVEEAGSIKTSQNKDWWVSSGAYLNSLNGTGRTIFGSLADSDPWYNRYLSGNPLDTDNGIHPQNIFRLVLKSQWQDFTQQAYFKIKSDNLSTSPNRNSSNGLLFFNRYKDAFNLYYTGIRVDGHTTIKKKNEGCLLHLSL